MHLTREKLRPLDVSFLVAFFFFFYVYKSLPLSGINVINLSCNDSLSEASTIK